MSSIVLELQHEALDGTIRVSTLLKKALLVATKLNQKDFINWIDTEIGGFKAGQEIPPYRQLSGTLKAKNFGRWIPVVMNSSEEQELLSMTVLAEGISALESMLEQRSKSSIVGIPVTNEARVLLNQMTNSNFDTDFIRELQFSQVAQVIDTVRTVILKWTMELEKENILGEGMTFTPEEKRHADSPTYNVNNFYGQVVNSQIQQGTTDSTQELTTFNLDIKATNQFLEKVWQLVPQMNMDKETKKEVESEIESIKAQLKSSKPKGSIIRECFHSLRAILEGAGGAVSAVLLIELAKLHLHLFGS